MARYRTRSRESRSRLDEVRPHADAERQAAPHTERRAAAPAPAADSSAITTSTPDAPTLLALHHPGLRSGFPRMTRSVFLRPTDAHWQRWSSAIRTGRGSSPGTRTGRSPRSSEGGASSPSRAPKCRRCSRSTRRRSSFPRTLPAFPCTHSWRVSFLGRPARAVASGTTDFLNTVGTGEAWSVYGPSGRVYQEPRVKGGAPLGRLLSE